MKPKRKQIGKKLRFEVFKRDNFSCQYCGNTPPTSILEVDHITPVSKGGLNDIDNLITACFNCNRGKSNIELTNIPKSINDKHTILIEKDLQFKEYQKLINKTNKILNKQVQKVVEIYEDWFPDYTIDEKFANSSIKMFIKKLDNATVEDAMNTACSRNEWNWACKYFCGICWNIIKGNTYE